jgi:hypothetical protein
MAVGNGPANGSTNPLVARSDGRRWQSELTADPSSLTGLRAATLYGVECISSRACIVVGEYGKRLCHRHDCSVTVTLPFAARWSDAGWSLQATPKPSGSGIYSAFTAVSCASPSECVAVGYRDDNRPLAERWDGRTWSIQRTPGTGALMGVSCTSTRACTAVGSSGVESSERPLAERWDGRRWSIQRVPSPPRHSGLDGVSCISRSACTAVGDLFVPLGGGSRTFAERWNGHSWSRQTTPNVGAYAEFLSVSCTSNTDCTAVGESYASMPTNGNATTLAERWDGVTWTREATPNSRDPAEPGSYLHAVSCTARAVCTAVGNDQGNNALAEQRAANSIQPPSP